MNRRFWLLALPFVLGACEGDELFARPDAPDAGEVIVPDAGEIDAGFPDAGVVETPDAGEPPPASEPVYIHTGDTLFSYDPTTNTTTRIGDFAVERGELESMVDIAIDSEGRMFGGTRASGSNSQENRIYQIDPQTGLCRYRFSYDDTLHGLTFLPDGRLVIAGERVSVVDPTSGLQLLEFPGANAYETSGDIVGLPDGQLYWTVRGERRANGTFASDGVVRINPITGDLAWIGEAQVTRIYGLGYAEGELFGFSSTGVVVTIEPNSGNVVRQNMLEGRWFGATTNPVRWE